MSDEKLDLAGEVLDLLVQLWPKPATATVHLETHQWTRLRDALLAVIEHLVEEDDAVPAGDLDQTVILPPVPGSTPWIRSQYPGWERAAKDPSRRSLG